MYFKKLAIIYIKKEGKNHGQDLTFVAIVDETAADDDPRPLRALLGLLPPPLLLLLLPLLVLPEPGPPLRPNCEEERRSGRPGGPDSEVDALRLDPILGPLGMDVSTSPSTAAAVAAAAEPRRLEDPPLARPDFGVITDSPGDVAAVPAGGVLPSSSSSSDVAPVLMYVAGLPTRYCVRILLLLPGISSDTRELTRGLNSRLYAVAWPSDQKKSVQRNWSLGTTRPLSQSLGMSSSYCLDTSEL